MRRATETPASRFLDTATLAQLLWAVTSNHRTWIARIVRVAGGEVTIPFPQLGVRKAGEHLDVVVRRCDVLDRLRHVS